MSKVYNGARLAEYLSVTYREIDMFREGGHGLAYTRLPTNDGTEEIVYTQEQVDAFLEAHRAPRASDQGCPQPECQSDTWRTEGEE